MFGPINSGVALVTLWLIFGISIRGRLFFGYAPLRRLDSTLQKQIKVYLEEIGVIDVEYTKDGEIIIKSQKNSPYKQ